MQELDTTAKAVQLKTLKTGDLFTRKPYIEPRDNQIFSRDEYDHSDRKYFCGRWSDISDAIKLAGDTLVYKI